MNAAAVMETSKLSGKNATCVPIYQPVMVTAATRMHVSASFSRESFKMAIKSIRAKKRQITNQITNTLPMSVKTEDE